MPPKSLVQLCTKACIKNVAMITDLGDMPNNRARPILLKVESGTQLHEIEMNCPHLAIDTPEVWKRLIARHFPLWEKKNYVPKNPSSWYKVYARYKKEHDEELAEAEARLKNAFATLETQKEARKSKIVEQRFLPRPPRDGRAVGGRRTGGGADLPSHLSFGGGSRTRLTDGQSFLKKARREALEVASRRALSTPTGQLPVRPGQIQKAPEGMVNEHRIKQQPEIRILVPRSKPKLSAEDLERKEREGRLLRLKNLSSGRTPQVVSDSEDEGDGPDLADLFEDEDEEEPRPTSSRKAAVASAASSVSASTPKKKPILLPQSRKNAGLLSNAHRLDGQRRNAYSPPGSSPQASPSPPLKPQKSDSRHAQPASGRTTGLLLNSSRPESQRQIARPPPNKAIVDPVKPPTGTSLSPPPNSHPGQSSASVPANSSNPALRKRKPAVDIFMRRPKKIPRQ
ncbi:RNA polymerase II transcription factor SIII subunit A-domain-containing protein [Phialemonium atrogriseum]|uniref:RNA polymerase II transcription factor SIII subunit A-domain-containing protein n=1 Tax=Phialemonium atrogriseum TaxID=1093897 RepID=A0AAJ0FPE0_9PEZI|nr:RNA polymerase II transcription factor SIII subunit A-domain-containing protein [Phialemonium atrogriseum]KAK1769994.1 RNA polymerase II transcription factor SIII subunit A-domain-containing protein [Phialemonium atrogriseum]